MKPVAIFDIDGTIFRSSLTIELLDLLVSIKVFEKNIIRRIKMSEQSWLNRKGSYENYITEVVKAYQKAIVGKYRNKIIAASRQVIAKNKDKTYRYTRELLNKIHPTHFTIGISGSPLEVVNEYNKFLKFDKVYGWEFGTDELGRYTDKVLHSPPLYKKELIIRYLSKNKKSLSHSLGIGDTESDIGFLSIVEKPIAFNPNRNLAIIAKKYNWTTVVERKDLIIEFKPATVKYRSV